MSGTDQPAPEVRIEAPAPPRGPGRPKGPYLATARKKGHAKKGAAKRSATPRVTEPRTVEDASTGGIFDARPQVSHMPREAGSFSPEYDGPGERVSRVDRDTNQFAIPQSVQTKLRNAGWDVAWKTVKVLLADINEVDGTELRAAYNAGWRPAKAKDFPELCVPGGNPEGTVDAFGQRLFIRPAHMTRAAQLEDERFAKAQMESRMAATQEGRSVRSDEEGLEGMDRIVRPVALGLSVEGEFGSRGVR